MRSCAFPIRAHAFMGRSTEKWEFCAKTWEQFRAKPWEELHKERLISLRIPFYVKTAAESASPFCGEIIRLFKAGVAGEHACIGKTSRKNGSSHQHKDSGQTRRRAERSFATIIRLLE